MQLSNQPTSDQLSWRIAIKFVEQSVHWLLTLLSMLLQDMSDDEIGSLAVNTLALLRAGPESSGDSQRSYPQPSPSTRRRRKPSRPTVRTLY